MKLAALLLVAACGSAPTPPPRPVPVAVDEIDPPEPPIAGQEGDDTIDIVDVDPKVDRTLLAEAMHTFHSVRATAYTHKTTIDVAQGRFEFDCSGFVGYVLAQSQPRALAELRAATKKRPLAKHFVEFFQSLPPDVRPNQGGPPDVRPNQVGPEDSAWRSIARAEDLAPGDLIAWLKPSDVVSKNTGHVMIVREPPRRHPKHPDVWIVNIIDSTAVPHGKGDSRKQTKATGLGTGDILLVVDDAGAPIGYRWSQGKKARLHMTTIALAGVRDQK